MDKPRLSVKFVFLVSLVLFIAAITVNPFLTQLMFRDRQQEHAEMKVLTIALIKEVRNLGAEINNSSK
jgi:hypothetical protein